MASERTVRPTRTPKRSSKVSRYNIGTFILMAFCVYIFINIILFFRRSHLTIYEVQKQSMASNTKAEAVIVRNETPVKTGIAGYVNYFMRSGSKVAKGETVYSIDESKQIYKLISEDKLKVEYTESDIEEIKSHIISFSEKYSPYDFSSVISLRDELNSDVNGIRDVYLLEHLNEVLDDPENLHSMTVHKSEAPGLISFFSDSLDGLTVEQVNLSTFDKTLYKSYTLFDTNLKEQGSVIYKLLSDETWDLVLNLTEEQYNSLSDKTSLSFMIEEDNLRLTAPVIFSRNGDGYFARITLKQYMVRYLNKRFLTISLDMDRKEGLKIPKSALIDKEFYMIPKEYFTRGGDQGSSQQGVSILSHDVDNNNKTVYDFIPTEIYYEDDSYKYIDMKTITYGAYIYNQETEEKFQISLVGRLTGVYCVNKGFAQFRRVEMEQDGKEFCIVKSGISYSISEHDHIAEDAKGIQESQTIY